MKTISLLSSLFFLIALAGCSSAPSSGGPVIDSLDVPETTTPVTVRGQTGPGVVLTLSAHDDSAGITTLHLVFTEQNMDEPISIPGSPTTLNAQKVQLVVLNAPSGAHKVLFHLTDAKNQNSVAIMKTITVP